jgi:FkbM family methyltransferase
MHLHLHRFVMSVRNRIRRFLARNRRHPLIGKIGRGLAFFADGYQNYDWDIATNGERFVLETIGRHRPDAMVFDVGASTGEWARFAVDAIPNARIHSFEVIPTTFEKLRIAASQLPGVSTHNLGLGEAEGTLEFSVAKGRDDLTSGVAGVHGVMHKFEFVNMTCPITTGDLFCAAREIEHIDLLKIDVEGMEPQVIRGFAGMLRDGRIGALQFEYGQISLQARFFLGDFYNLLTPYGMRIGKIYPNYVDFRDYSFIDDRLIGPNYLAVPKKSDELLRLLAG